MIHYKSETFMTNDLTTLIEISKPSQLTEYESMFRHISL